MPWFRTSAVLAAAVFIGVTAHPQDKDRPAQNKPAREQDRLKEARRKLDARLQGLHPENAKIELIRCPELEKLFPDETFFSVLYPQRPRATPIPKFLRAGNLFVVSDKGSRRISELDDLADLFLPALRGGPIDTTRAQPILTALIHLVPHLVQDGGYKFHIDPKAYSGAVRRQSPLPLDAAAHRATVTEGGTGSINVTLWLEKGPPQFTFDVKVTKK